MKKIFAIFSLVTLTIGFMGSCDKDNDNTPESPLSVVTMNIIPDYSDGSVGGVKVSSFNGEYTYSFNLGVTVTPEKFAKELAESDGYVRKAVFAPVATKGSTEGGFSLTPSQVTCYGEVDQPYISMCFELDSLTATMMQCIAYAVSFSIEDKDGNNGTSTAFVPLSNKSDSPVPEETLVAVDLGLSVKWANKNLGALSPSGYGKCYAWGATEPYYEGPSDEPTSWIKKGGYIWQNAPFNGGSSDFNSSYYSEHKSEFVDENGVLRPEFDAARIELGDGWRMPTKEEFDELLANTICSYGTFTSKTTGKSIFLPEQGYYDGTDLIRYKYSDVFVCYYWSSTCKMDDEKDTKYAHSLYLIPGCVYMIGQDLRYGLPIRPVYDK